LAALAMFFIFSFEDCIFVLLFFFSLFLYHISKRFEQKTGRGGDFIREGRCEPNHAMTKKKSMAL